MSNSKKIIDTHKFIKSDLKISTKMYSNYIDNVIKRLGNKVTLRKINSHSIFERVPGIENLIKSFSALSYFQQDKSHFEEWNPFSQRPFIFKQPLNPKNLIRNFGETSTQVTNFVNLTHESLHVLLLEPFFIGQLNFKNEKSFLKFNLVFEGLCFWYADIYFTPLIKEQIPDGEFVFSKYSISQPHFHPEVVFRKLKLNPKAALEIYLKAFNGYKTKLFKANDPYIHSLGNQITAFYALSEKPLIGLFKSLKKMSYFKDFQLKFCSIENLPTLLPNSIIRKAHVDSLNEYCHLIVDEGLEYLKTLDDSVIDNVKLRRSIQTRAYFVYSLKYIIENQQIYSKSVIPKNTVKNIILDINSYIDRLQELIQLLTQESNPSSILTLLNKIDLFYDKNIRLIFKKHNVWVNHRFLILPFSKIQNSLFGINSLKFNLSKKKLKYLIEEFNKLSLKEKNLSLHITSQHLYYLESLYLSLFSSKKINLSLLHKSDRAIKKYLTNESILSLWSVRLDEIDPYKNSYRELLFVYE